MKHLPDHSAQTAAERIKYVRKAKGVSQTEMAKVMGVSQSTLSQVENANYDISFESIKRLSETYNINCNWLILGTETMYLSGTGEDTDDNDSNLKNGIPLVSSDAIAGYVNNIDNQTYLQSLETYRLPVLANTGERRIFEMKDDAMLPVFKSGDYLIAGRPENPQQIPNGKLSVVVCKDRLKVARLYRYPERQGFYTLKQDNTGSDSEIISMTELLEVWEITGRITHHADEKIIAEELIDIRKMQQDISSLKDQIEILMQSTG